MKTNSLISIIIICTILSACKGDDEPVLKSEGGFPASPKNLTIFNSEYDDYNSDLEPGVYDMYNFVFSSNRTSEGNDFDILLFSVDLGYQFNNDILSISISAGKTTEYFFLEEMLTYINTSNDEFGPYILNCNLNNDFRNMEYLFFYTQEQSNKLNIRFIVNELDSTGNSTTGYNQTGPYNVSILNTEEYNEEYISVVNSIIYYCSDKEGNFNIYQKSLNTDTNIVGYLTRSYEQNDNQINIINSEAQDKCPYVIDSFIVFTSDRQGGFGRYDLYYSKIINGEWTEPQNFGGLVNSEFDEYRPIIRLYKNIPNDLMVFSSNRKGGLGGYDLYYTGISETR